MLHIDDIAQAGIVGCGGGGFPLHLKLENDIETLIINAVECEPGLWTDKYIAGYDSRPVLNAIAFIKTIKKPKRILLVFKEKYSDNFSILINEGKKLGIEPVAVRDYYPSGDELILIFDALGLRIDAGKIPKDYCLLVSNLETLWHLGRALKGKALIGKYLTVHIPKHKPYIIYAPIGTLYEDILKSLGINKSDDEYLIENGLMMGSQVNTSSSLKPTIKALFLTKPTKVLKESLRFSFEMQKRRNLTACIQCSRCTDLCSRSLIGHYIKPHRIMRGLLNNDDRAIDFGLFLCSECGLCELFACPMGIQPRGIIRGLKAMLMDKRSIPEGLAKTSFRDYRLVPSRVIYDRLKINSSKPMDKPVVVKPKRVSFDIPTGSSLLVKNGDRVDEGQAIIRQGNGVYINASIKGKIMLEEVLRIEG